MDSLRVDLVYLCISACLFLSNYSPSLSPFIPLYPYQFPSPFSSLYFKRFLTVAIYMTCSPLYLSYLSTSLYVYVYACLLTCMGECVFILYSSNLLSKWEWLTIDNKTGKSTIWTNGTFQIAYCQILHHFYLLISNLILIYFCLFLSLHKASIWTIVFPFYLFCFSVNRYLL